MNELEKSIRSLFRRIRNRDAFVKIKEETLNPAIDQLIDNANKMIKETIGRCKILDFDAVKFINSPEGQAAYLRFVVDEDQKEKNLETQCHRCSHYWWQRKNKRI